MKRLFLLLISAMIYGVVFTGCLTNEATKEEKPAGELYVIGATSVGSKLASVNAGDKANLVFTDEDIVSFNALYGEIVFTKTKFDEIISRLSLHTELQFFIGDKPVFDPPIKIHYGWGITNDDFDLQFRTDGVKTYLTDMYMFADSLLLQENREQWEQSKQKRKKELDILINYLDAEGKITKQEAPLPLPEDTLNYQPSCDKSVIVNDTSYVQTPDYPVTIIDLRIESNCLKIKFSASGCDGNSWGVNLFATGSATAVYPPQWALKLVLDNKEACTAIITKEVSFNIEALQMRSTSKVQLNILGHSILYEY